MLPTRRWALAAALALNACAMAAPVPPGPGDVTQASRERLARQREESLAEVTQRACLIASQQRDDLRAQRKATELARTLLDALRNERQPVTDSATVLAWCKPAIDRLASDTCATGAESAAVYRSAQDHEQAARRFGQVAHECRNADAAIEALYELRQLKRCPEGVTLVAENWQGSPQDSWIRQFDAVQACSNSVSLRQNLSFLPSDVREDYFALLEQRRIEEERYRAAAERAAREEQARQAAWHSRMACQDDCSRAASQCRSGCGSSASCFSHCDALGSACNSGCH